MTGERPTDDWAAQVTLSNTVSVEASRLPEEAAQLDLEHWPLSVIDEILGSLR